MTYIAAIATCTTIAAALGWMLAELDIRDRVRTDRRIREQREQLDAQLDAQAQAVVTEHRAKLDKIRQETPIP